MPQLFPYEDNASNFKQPKFFGDDWKLLGLHCEKKSLYNITIFIVC